MSFLPLLRVGATNNVAGERGLIYRGPAGRASVINPYLDVRGARLVSVLLQGIHALGVSHRAGIKTQENGRRRKEEYTSIRPHQQKH